LLSVFFFFGYLRSMKPLRLLSALIVLLTAGCQSHQDEGVQRLALLFEQPAVLWEERLPLGNGRLGAMADGGVSTEHIFLNESSLWSGSPADDNKQEAYKNLPLIRELLYNKQVEEAQELMYNSFASHTTGSEGSYGAETTFGSYQLLGSVALDFSYDAPVEQATGYNRMLDIATATTFTSYTINRTTYTRECFTSFSNDVLVMYLTASQPGALNFKASLDRPENARIYTDENTLIMEGSLFSGQEEKEGMGFYARLDIVPCERGTLTGLDNQLQLSGATHAVVILSATTNYNPATLSVSSDSLYIRRADSLSLAAQNTPYPELKKNHVDTYQSLFHRVHLNLPDNTGLYFQMGRYLLISSTRPGYLPPNLQGLWTSSIQTPRNGAYDLNMHLQMNLWPALKTNLANLHLPLLDFTGRLAARGTETARAYYNAPGWVAHAMTNPWGYTAPGQNIAWGGHHAAGAWLCAHLWDHYAYTQDLERLRTDYPVMKEAALFYLSLLMEDPDYRYKVPAPSMSYGNMYYLPYADDPLSVPGTRQSVALFLCMGSTSDVQMVQDLFTHVIAANKLLRNTDDFPLIHQLEEALNRLPEYRVNATGGLLRWLVDYPEEDTRQRNVPHLYALYPGNAFTENTPGLLEACRNTLERRGQGGSAWQMAWNLNLYARLGDGEEAYRILHRLMSPALEESTSPYNVFETEPVTLLTPGTYPNGFSSNPHFQIDGNLGGCAGIAEMLLQCHQGYIHVLPAIPAAWEAEGSFSGLCVRGGGTVSCRWKEGLVREIILTAQTDNSFILKIPPNFQGIKEKYITLALKKGEQLKIHERSTM
jgi:alpha-L-fucosidase 2